MRAKVNGIKTADLSSRLEGRHHVSSPMVSRDDSLGADLVSQQVISLVQSHRLRVFPQSGLLDLL